MDVPAHSPRYIALAARLQATLGAAPHLALIGALHEQLGAREADHVVLGDQRLFALVLERATEVRDRGHKMHVCMRVEALHEYLLISQERPQVERYWRHDGGWLYQSYRAGESIALTTGHTLIVDALYDGVWNIAGEDAADQLARDYTAGRADAAMIADMEAAQLEVLGNEHDATDELDAIMAENETNGVFFGRGAEGRGKALAAARAARTRRLTATEVLQDQDLRNRVKDHVEPPLRDAVDGVLDAVIATMGTDDPGSRKRIKALAGTMPGITKPPRR